MKRWLRRLAAPVFVAILAMPLAGCGEGNGTNCIQLIPQGRVICL